MTDLQAPSRLDSEQAERTEAFRADLANTDKRALGVALASGAFALAQPARGQSMGSVTTVLNFALKLEYLEREFYKEGVDSGVIESNADGSYDALGKYTEIRNNEQEHVTLLKGALGDDAIDQPTFDFTAGGKFDPFNKYTDFLVLSQGFEDLGVRAYKGQARFLVDDPNVLTTALRIHSVEGRHASVVRRLLAKEGVTMQDGWIEGAGANAPNPIAGVYEAGDQFPAEDDQTVAGLDISGTTDPDGDAYSSELLTESYDEPLSRSRVQDVAAPFIESN